MISIDALLENFPGSIDGFRFENGPVSIFSNQNPLNGFEEFGQKPVDSAPSPPTHLESPNESGPSSDASSNGESRDTNKYSNPILRYISDILMDEEDDLERKPCMLQDCLKLQAAEKSFSDVLDRSYPSSPHKTTACFQNDNNDSPHDNFGQSYSFESNYSHTTDTFFESDRSNDSGDFVSSLLENSLDYSLENIQENSLVASHPFGETQFAGLQNGIWNFIQSQSNLLMNQEGTIAVHNPAPGKSREKRTHRMDDTTDEEDVRDSKLSAAYSDDSEPDLMFNELLLLSQRGGSKSLFCDGQGLPLQDNGNFKQNGNSVRPKKGTNKGAIVDLWTLLTQCAQAVSNYDQRNAHELLKQIRQNSSPFGNGMERLAYYFANGLETRLAAGTPACTPLDCNGATAAEMLRAYRLYIMASPFQRMPNFLANRTILKLAENETRIHIIDFGICYGFQWPCLIQRLSERPQGPPQLRITGIDFPQPGFRPAERVEETGRRLANYCRRFNVPFEYNSLAQKWETIQLEDLKIDSTEVTVVNCLFRLKNVLDETVAVNSPRDAVLKLIRKINPNLFIHGIVNGTYNAPFFMTRFREALFHFSSLFDMFEATVPREDVHRMMFEKGIFGRDATNVLACEGAERVERPETYKQWQARNQRVGFKQLRFDPSILNKAKEMVKTEYHKDFVAAEDGKWVLQGWKGRIVHALSCWKPA